MAQAQDDSVGVVDLALTRFGSIDGLVNNAGTLDPVARIHDARGGDWTDGFADDFRCRYGYDPLPYLPVLTGRVAGSASGVSSR